MALWGNTGSGSPRWTSEQTPAMAGHPWGYRWTPPHMHGTAYGTITICVERTYFNAVGYTVVMVMSTTSMSRSTLASGVKNTYECSYIQLLPLNEYNFRSNFFLAQCKTTMNDYYSHMTIIIIITIFAVILEVVLVCMCVNMYSCFQWRSLCTSLLLLRC